MATTTVDYVQQYRESIKEALDTINESGGALGNKTPTVLLKIKIAGKAVTVSLIKGFEDSIACYYDNSDLCVPPPNPNMTNGAIQSNNRIIPPITLILPGNAAEARGALLDACNKQTQMDIEIVYLSLTNGKQIPLEQRTLGGVITLKTPQNHVLGDIEVMSTIVQAQTIEIKPFAIGPDGVKKGAATVLKYNAGTCAIGG